MKLVPRRNAASAEVTAETEEPETDVVAGGKGRPTPKRRDSVPQRGPVTAPRTRKEAYARQKQQARDARAARRTSAPMTAAQRRQALRAGDPALLPRRDQGETRQLARDYVDSHRMISNFLLLVLPLLILSYVIPIFGIIAPLALIVVVIEWYLVGTRIRKMSAERFGKADGGNMSIGFYAGSRAYLPRRWRLPAPRVERGESI